MKKNYNTSFVINKYISTTGLFSKIELTPAAKLTLRAIADYWNYNMGIAFPTHSTLARNTGLTEFSIRKAVNELCDKKLITKTKKNKRFYYKFTATLFRLMDIEPKEPCGNTERKLRYIPQESCANNIIKENKNTSFLNSFYEEECTETDKDKILFEKLKDNPAFASIIKGIKSRMEASTT